MSHPRSCVTQNRQFCVSLSGKKTQLNQLNNNTLRIFFQNQLSMWLGVGTNPNKNMKTKTTNLGSALFAGLAKSAALTAFTLAAATVSIQNANAALVPFKGEGTVQSIDTFLQGNGLFDVGDTTTFEGVFDTDTPDFLSSIVTVGAFFEALEDFKITLGSLEMNFTTGNVSVGGVHFPTSDDFFRIDFFSADADAVYGVNGQSFSIGRLELSTDQNLFSSDAYASSVNTVFDSGLDITSGQLQFNGHKVYLDLGPFERASLPISSVPEPGAYGVLGALAIFGMIIKRRMTKDAV